VKNSGLPREVKSFTRFNSRNTHRAYQPMEERKEHKGSCPQTSLIFADLVLSAGICVICGRILQLYQ
jgi:hypothetical protein